MWLVGVRGGVGLEIECEGAENGEREIDVG